ncbi:alpha/beta fold hydrolase [Streptodolium elevatio]
MTGRIVTREAFDDLAGIPADSRWVRTESLQLHVLDYAGPAGPASGERASPEAGRAPVVLLPGITMPAIGMDFVARELADSHRVLVVDARGRGMSDSGPSYTLEDYAEDTEAVLDALCADGPPPVLVGHSLGARIAAAVAVRAKAALGGTVLVDPPLSGPGRGPYPTSADAFLGQLAEARNGTTAERVAASWPRWPRREQELRARWLASCDPEAVAATHRGFEAEDFFRWWPSVPAPAVFLYGAESPVVTSEGAAEAAARNPEASFAAVPGAAHMVFWDNPSEAVGALRGALRGMTP